MRDRRAVLTLLCVVRLTMGLQFQSIAPVAPLLARDLGLTYAELGLLIGVFMAPGALLALPGGLLGARFGDRRIILAALALMTAGGALLALSGSFGTALVGRLLSGSGSILLNLYLTKVLADWFAGAALGTAMGLMLSMFPLGVALSLATLGAVAVATSWRVAIAASAGYAALALVLFAVLYREPGRQPPGEPAPLWAITPREIALVLPLAVAWSAVNAGFFVYIAFTPMFLVERGWTLAAAGFLVSWASWLSIASLPLGGWLVDRTGRPGASIVAATLAAAVTCVMITLAGPPIVWIVLNELLSGPMVAIVALAGTALRPASRATGLGIFYAVSYAGSIAVPALAGHLLDATGTAATALWLAAAVWLTIVPALGVFHVLRRHRVPVVVADVPGA